MNAQPSLASFYDGWGAFNDQLIQAIAPLTKEQLDLRDAAQQRSVRELAAHIAGVRAGWFVFDLEVKDPVLETLAERYQHPEGFDAAELVDGLRKSWASLNRCLSEWTPDMLDDTFIDEGETLSRRWIIWHVIEHDCVHGGELFLTLGSHGIAVPHW